MTDSNYCSYLSSFSYLQGENATKTLTIRSRDLDRDFPGVEVKPYILKKRNRNLPLSLRFSKGIVGNVAAVETTFTFPISNFKYVFVHFVI